MREVARIALPAHVGEGGFDHAAVYSRGARLYVAHTANDAIDVVDLAARRYTHSLHSLRGVAGVWVSEERGLLFSSNRGEDTVSIFELPEEKLLLRAATGSRPNGMAFDPASGILLVAGVGNPAMAAPPTVTLIDVGRGKRLEQLQMPGRTRWALFHRKSRSFYVNIADPPSIAEIEIGNLSQVHRFLHVPSPGPHGLEQDSDGSTLYCASDGKRLVELDLPAGHARTGVDLGGPPDVLWLDPASARLCVAIGDPGMVQVFGTHPLSLLETVPSEEGAHTLTIDPSSGEVHVFLPDTHSDLILGGRSVA